MAGTAAPAQQAPVWRCGNAYSHQPCAQGRQIDAQDARTPEQQEQARRQAAQTSAFADALHRENAARDAQRRREELAQQKALAKQQAALRRAERQQAARAAPRRVSVPRRAPRPPASAAR